VTIGPEPAPKSEVIPPPRSLTLVVHDVADLNAPGPKVGPGRKGGCDGKGEQSARVGRENASADFEAVAPSTGFAGNGIAAVIG
jgi:hypothetical protein